MKAGDHDDLPFNKTVEDPVWKALEKDATGVAVDDWSTQRVGDYSIKGGSDCTEELFSKALALILIPLIRVLDVGCSRGA